MTHPGLLAGARLAALTLSCLSFGLFSHSVRSLQSSPLVHSDCSLDLSVSLLPLLLVFDSASRPRHFPK